jgi:hypothetical protein
VQKRKHVAIRQATDLELRWKAHTTPINRPAFSGCLGLSPNLGISEDHSPIGIFHLYFDKILTVIQKRQTGMQNNK